MRCGYPSCRSRVALSLTKHEWIPCVLEVGWLDESLAWLPYRPTTSPQVKPLGLHTRFFFAPRTDVSICRSEELRTGTNLASILARDRQVLLKCLQNTSILPPAQPPTTRTGVCRWEIAADRRRWRRHAWPFEGRPRPRRLSSYGGGRMWPGGVWDDNLWVETWMIMLVNMDAILHYYVNGFVE